MRVVSFIAVVILCVGVAYAVGLPTSQVAIVGSFAKGPIDVAMTVEAAAFGAHFGSIDPENHPAEVQARQYFRNGGTSATVVRIDPQRPVAEALLGSISPPQLRGLGALLPVSDLGLLVCPELTTLSGPEISTCLQRLAELGEGKPLFTVLDTPPAVTTVEEVITWRQTHLPDNLTNAAIYFPQLSLDPATWSGGTSALRIVAGASGTVAAVIGHSDATRGIWKSPAGNTASFFAEGLAINLTDAQNGLLNPAGINALRNFNNFGNIVWGGRTLDVDAENKYINIVRTRRWIVRSLQRDLSDAALQPNGPALWSNLRSRSEVFLQALFLQGAFAGTTPNEAYFVRCDASTTSASDIAAHRANVLLGVALSRPAEFSIELLTLATLNVAKPAPDLPVLISKPISGVIHLAYPTTPGFNHSLQSSATMTAASWLDGGAIPGDGSWKRIEIPATEPRRLFRVKTVTGW